MPLYKLTRGSIGIVVGEGKDEKIVDVRKGQTVELPSDEKARSYSKYLKRVGAPETSAATPVTVPISTATAESRVDAGPTVLATSIARDWSATQDMKAVEVIALANETTSVSELEALYEVEEKGQNRPSVLKAIEKKVTQLEGG